MKDFTTMDAARVSAARRSLPFGAYMLQASGNPDWRKIGRGMIAAVGSDADGPMIYPGKVYAVEIHNGQIGFASYRRKPRDDEPYSYNYGRLCAVHGDYEIDRWPYDLRRDDRRCSDSISDALVSQVQSTGTVSMACPITRPLVKYTTR